MDSVDSCAARLTEWPSMNHGKVVPSRHLNRGRLDAPGWHVSAAHLTTGHYVQVAPRWAKSGEAPWSRATTAQD